MPSLEIHRDGAHKLYQVLERELRIGGDEACGVRIDGAPARAAVLRANDAGGHEIEGQALELNGKALRGAHVLEHGDVVRIGHTLLVFLEDGQPRPIVPRKLRERAAAGGDPAPAPEPAPVVPEPEPSPPAKPDSGIVVGQIRAMPARTARPPAEERERRPRRSSSGSTPPWAVLSLAGLGGVVLIFVLVQVLSAGAGRDPNDLLNLAEIKLKRGEISVAQSYVDQAEQGRPDAAAQRRIRELRSAIDATAKRSADLGAIRAASRGFNHLQRVKANYLDGKTPARPQAREFVREVDEWLEAHRAICEAYDEERKMLRQVEQWRAAFAPVAALGEPDTADDVLFKAGRLTWPKYKRDYRGAIDLLDGFLASASDSADVERVRTQRTEWIADSREFFDKSVGQIDRLVRDGRVEIALDRIRFLSAASLPDWADEARAKLAEVEAAVR